MTRYYKPKTGTTPSTNNLALSPYMKALRKRQKEALAKRKKVTTQTGNANPLQARKGKSGKDVDFSKGTTKSRILAAQLAKAKAAKKAGTTPESKGVKGSTLREKMLAKKIAAEKAKNPSRFKDSPVKATVTKPKVKPKTKKPTTQTGGAITKGGELKLPNTQTAGVKPKPRTGIRPKIIKEKRQEVTKPKTGFNVTKPRTETTNPIRPRVSVGSKATKPDVKERPRRSVKRGSRLAEIRKKMLERTTRTSPRRRSSSNRSQAPSRPNTSQRSSRSRFSRQGRR
tara:strand:- start:245 stop:1096 length:852 start_codon:yes stop_codon:yes gene_type:complete